MKRLRGDEGASPSGAVWVLEENRENRLDTVTDEGQWARGWPRRALQGLRMGQREEEDVSRRQGQTGLWKNGWL